VTDDLHAIFIQLNFTNGRVTGAELREAVLDRLPNFRTLKWITGLLKSDRTPVLAVMRDFHRRGYAGEDGRMFFYKDVVNETLQEVPLGKLPVPKMEYVIVYAEEGKHMSACSRDEECAV
jgi:hypothetical protein